MKRLFHLLWRVALGGAAAAIMHAADLAFSTALAALAIGLWWERPSLALIVPGLIVLALCVAGRIGMLRGD